MSSRRSSGSRGTQDGADTVRDALQQGGQGLARLQEALSLHKQEAERRAQEAERRMQEALRQQKQEAERKVQEAERRMQEALRLQKKEAEREIQEALHLHKKQAERRMQEALRLQEETLRKMDRNLKVKDNAIRTLQQRLQETHVRMTALEERTTAPKGSAGEGLQRLEGRVNEVEASLQSALQTFMPRVEALLRQLEEPQSTRATGATAAASARQEPETGGTAAGGGERPPPSSSSTRTPTRAGHQGAAADEEMERLRVELRVREANKMMWDAQNCLFVLGYSVSPLGEQLCEAAKEGRLSDVQRLIDSSADVNYIDRYGSTPLIRAAINAKANVVSLLLQRGTNVNAVNSNGATALHVAALNKLNSRCVELLARAGADVNARDKDGKTPLHCAAQRNNEEAVRALLAAGARRDLKPWGGGGKGKTPIETTTSPIIKDLLRL